MRYQLESEATRQGPWSVSMCPMIEWEQEPADESVLSFCGAELIGRIGGMLPRGKDTPQIRNKLYEGMYGRIRDNLGEFRMDSRGIRLIMADRTGRPVNYLCVENFAKWLKKRWPAQMTETRVCRNPNSGNPTKVWVFRIP